MSEAATTFDSLVRKVARVEAEVLAPGQVLDEAYELIERIGGGGMGIVFRARDLRLGREVAVKTLRAAFDEDALRLFEREARATAQLLHPNIVTLHHVGVHDGRPFLVLELLTGETLAARLARRAFTVDEALDILDHVLAAVGFAHDRGVLHRDLKPNNIFVTADERIKVLDFGIALSLDASPGTMTRGAGTPGYMAPEQRDGQAQDARTDVWAAALLFVECVLGRRPERDELAALPVTPAVREVLARAIDPDPARRPANANELRTLLGHARGRTRAAPRRRGARLAAMAALCAAVGTTGFALGYRLKSPAAAAPITAAEIGAKSWHVAAFGDLLLRIEPSGDAYGVYEHDDGIIAGTFTDGVFVGEWCEMPTQRAPDDAGRITLRFVRTDDRIILDGSWTYGTDATAAVQQDFLGISGPLGAINPLEKRLQHRAHCPKP